MNIRVLIRDGRIGRDPQLVGPNGLGEVLASVELDHFLEIGDVIKLVDGSLVRVIGATETLGSDVTQQEVSVANL